MDSMIYWIWLSLACSPSSPTFAKLIKEFGDAREIYEADNKKLSSVVGYTISDRTALKDKSLEKAEQIYHFCKKYNVGMLAYNDERYPNALRQIDTPPVLLYYRGKLPDFNSRFFVSTVGTRALSEYGRRTAFKVGYDLASAGAVVVSGMAMGIDGVAMAGAIAAGGNTVAVIGSGIDVCYPPQHLTLAREIVKNGCVLTEFAPGTQPSKYNFPKRNRIISGLSSATMVFEGPEKSGALITARYAKEQGRAVYALPGNVGSKNSELSNLLLKNGAKIFTSADDVINDYKAKYSTVINPFLLKDKVQVDMMATLREYSVVAVCPSDDIFEVPKPRRASKHISTEAAYEDNKGDDQPMELKSPSPTNFDKQTLNVYKRIPSDGSCSLEELVNEETSLRDVMKCLLKLEIGGFICMLPGEKVSRKFR